MLFSFRKISATTFYKDIYWDRFFASNSSCIFILDKILVGEKLEDICEVIGDATVGEAYEIKEFLNELYDSGDVKFKKILIQEQLIDILVYGELIKRNI